MGTKCPRRFIWLSLHPTHKALVPTLAAVAACPIVQDTGIPRASSPFVSATANLGVAPKESWLLTPKSNTMPLSPLLGKTRRQLNNDSPCLHFP